MFVKKWEGINTVILCKMHHVLERKKPTTHTKRPKKRLLSKWAKSELNVAVSNF